MKIIKYFRSLCLIVICTVILTSSNLYTDKVIAEPSIISQVAPSAVATSEITPLAIVAKPSDYLNKNVIFQAKFDKFSTLGLDYKPAFKSSEEYISFLIKRDDTNYDIPLSEMKLFLKREEAEKHIDLKTNDKIQVSGLVFSDALGDAWINVEDLVLIKKAPENNNGV